MRFDFCVQLSIILKQITVQCQCVTPHRLSQIPQRIEHLLGLLLRLLAEPVCWHTRNIATERLTGRLESLGELTHIRWVILQAFDVLDVGLRVQHTLRSRWDRNEQWLNRSWNIVNNVLLYRLLDVIDLRSSACDHRWIGLSRLLMVDDLLRGLLLHGLMWLMQMLACACNIVTTAILWLHHLTRCLDDVHFTDVLD